MAAHEHVLGFGWMSYENKMHQPKKSLEELVKYFASKQNSWFENTVEKQHSFSLKDKTTLKDIKVIPNDREKN